MSDTASNTKSAADMLKDIQAKNAAAAEGTQEAPPEAPPELIVKPEEQAVPGVIPATTPVQEVVVKAKPEELYQQYTSARISTCLITEKGKRINFTNYEHYTQDQDIIDYLDAEIKNGNTAMTKGGKVTSDELSPAAAAKRKIIEEFKASQAGRDFSQEGLMAERAKQGLSGGAGTGVAASDTVAN